MVTISLISELLYVTKMIFLVKFKFIHNYILYVTKMIFLVKFKFIHNYIKILENYYGI